jgi:hypothetical protein
MPKIYGYKWLQMAIKYKELELLAKSENDQMGEGRGIKPTSQLRAAMDQSFGLSEPHIKSGAQ